MMVIPQYVLKPGSKYRCKLTVREGSNEGAAFVVVEVRTGPSSGTFEVSPTSVQALDLVTMTGEKQKAQLFCIIPFNYCFFPNFRMGAVKKKSAYLTDLGMLTYQKLRTDRELSRGLYNCWHLTLPMHRNFLVTLGECYLELCANTVQENLTNRFPRTKHL